MAALDMHSSPRCQHVHYSGRPCKAPARRGRNYCVFHQAAHLDSGGCVLPIVEDVHSYQVAIIRIARALADDLIDSKKATALLYALQLAGSKLNDFVRQREEVEDPARALYKEISERYHARKHPFPAFIPDKELSAILKDIALEHRATQNAEARENVEIFPQEAQSPEPAIEHSPAPQPAGTTENTGSDFGDVSPDSPPPRNDIGRELGAEGAA